MSIVPAQIKDYVPLLIVGNGTVGVVHNICRGECSRIPNTRIARPKGDVEHQAEEQVGPARPTRANKLDRTNLDSSSGEQSTE